MIGIYLLLRDYVDVKSIKVCHYNNIFFIFLKTVIIYLSSKSTKQIINNNSLL